VHRDAIRFEHIFPIALWEATVVRPVRILSDSKAAQSRKPECLRPPLPRSAA
jgi:hypothetical protein